MKQHHLNALYLVVLMLLFTFSANTLAEQVRISGASTIQPIINTLRYNFEEQYGYSLHVLGGGSTIGIQEAQEGITHIGMVSRSLTSDEKDTLQYSTIGLDALVIVVNEANPVQTLTRQQIVQIYQGQMNNWEQLGGQDMPIILVTKEVGRSTLDLFEGYTGLHSPRRSQGGPQGYISRDAYEIGSNLEGLTIVGGLPGAIGYISYGAALSMLEKGMPIQIVQLDGVQIDTQALLQGRYPIIRELNLVYTESTAAIEALLGLIYSELGQNQIQQNGFIPTGEERGL